MNCEGWRVVTDFTFVDGLPTVDEIDRAIGGRPCGAHGLMSHAVNAGPWQTELEWEFDTREDARAALDRARSISVLHEPHVMPPRDRILRHDEWQIRASAVRAGRARCLFCGQRMPADHNMLFALDGVPAGGEVTLRCAHCDAAMGWQILSYRTCSASTSFSTP